MSKTDGDLSETVPKTINISKADLSMGEGVRPWVRDSKSIDDFIGEWLVRFPLHYCLSSPGPAGNA